MRSLLPGRRLALAMAAAAVFTVVVVGALLARGTGPATVTPAAAPTDALTFSGTDVMTGKPVRLEQFAGKPAVVTIWASWCPGCNAEARALARFVREHPEAAFVGVDFQDTMGEARAFYRRYDWRFPSVFDPDGRIADQLGLQGTPTTIFLDDEHREVARIVGETDEAGLADGLERATADA